MVRTLKQMSVSARAAQRPHTAMSTAMSIAKSLAAAFIVTAFCGSSLAQTTLPLPAFDNLPTVVKCLSGDGCTPSPAQPGAPRAICPADESIKSMPEALRSRIRDFGKTDAAVKCAIAESDMAPMAAAIRDGYEAGNDSTLNGAQLTAASRYVDDCLSPELLANAGPLSQSEQSFLNETVALIVERHNPAWGSPRPICTAIALGRFVVTARDCLPASVTSQAGRGTYLEDIALRLFSRPTLYGLVLHRFGSEIDPAFSQHNDIALLETVGAQELWRPQGATPRLGTIRLHEDLFALTTNIFLRVTANVRGGDEPDFTPATRLHHSILCRPAHIAPNGVFLHGCRLASVVTRGAPLFQRQEGRLVFVGIHAGTTETLADRSLAACAPGLPNYGIAIPPALLIRTFLK